VSEARIISKACWSFTPVWMDLALAALDMLPPGLVLDGVM
jgi:hypothetical protein